MNWLSKRKLRYKNQRIVPFDEIRGRARTGDIILFHKTTRKGFMETLEVDVLSPLVFDQTEFRHCGIVVRRNDGLQVMECADEFHSGHTDATYLTRGTGIRMVPIDALLTAYNRDNGDPHFGIRHISEELPPEKIDSFVRDYSSVNYLKFHKIATVLLSHALLPKKVYNRIVKRFDNEMMCSEFVHNFLNRSGVLGDYPSKLFLPYYIEDDERFRKLEIVKYSDIVRFTYGTSSAQGAA